MPLQTGLAFHRKRQTLENLSLERPQNLQSFYEAVEEALKKIENHLRFVELEYYGADRSPDEEIKFWLPALTIVMGHAKTGILVSKQQLKDVFDLYERSIGDPTMVVKLDKEAVQTTLEVMNKVELYIRQKFKDIMNGILLVLGFMKKYCLSFCGIVGDNYLETATNYEKQRRELAEAIKINLDDIPVMMDKFENDGLRISELGSVPRRIAERVQCGHIPFLVMFSGACENIRNACIGVRKWIQADDGYATFIQFDITDLEKKKETCGKLLRDLQVRVSHLDHRLKVCKRDIQECVSELKRVAAKEKSLRRQEEQFREDLHDLAMEMEIKELQKDEARKEFTDSTQKEREKVEKITSEIEQLKLKRPILERKSDDVKRKLEFMKFRRELKNKREDQLREIKEELREGKRELRRTEVECERLEKNILKLREVHRFKTSPEVLKKLFYNMPLTNKGAGGGGGRKKRGSIIDKLEKATRVTAVNIDKDWITLYRALPFHPPRGEENLRQDIEDITNTFLRDTVEVHAKQALYRWRRVHTRASVDDLKKTLISIKRKEIADKVEDELAKKKTVKPKPQQTVRFPKVLVQTQQVRVRHGLSDAVK
ncbi:intersectin-1-like isoform X2 [Ostrea edulis]|uniref:intersectin-1-like isoform X2 n=1 Tax=Ostrea edulis TaxID=37623 RepID=UPI0020957771|nr:intersectin-1-like isoform X2 [Ostrea edulis]XP_056008224.1 intersectin-1-like isoform X2 [Ostrea edulis]